MSQVSAAIASTLSDMEAQVDQDNLPGTNDGKRFVLRLCGAAGLAASRAGKFISLQRISGGNWRLLDVMDKDGKPNKLYIDEDKTPAQMRREIL